MITFKINEVIPHLKEMKTEPIYETEVIRIKRKCILKKFNSRNGWYVNWHYLSRNTEVYALVLKGTYAIQGMIAVQYDDKARAVRVVWGCAAQHDDSWRRGKKRFSGVGGYLLAIASDLSIKHGYDGFIYGEAMDKEVYEYYCKEYDALPIPTNNNSYGFMLSNTATACLREVFAYEWRDEIL